MPGPLVLNPVTLGVIFIIGGVGAIVTYAVYMAAEELGKNYQGPKIEIPPPGGQ